jgi:hypothetical protein
MTPQGLVWAYVSNPGPMVPISDSNLLSEIAQVAEGLEFIDGPQSSWLGELLKTCFAPPPGPPTNRGRSSAIPARPSGAGSPLEGPIVRARQPFRAPH